MTPSLRSAASHGEVDEAHESESESARLLYPQGCYKNARGTQAEKGTWVERRALRAFAIGLVLIQLTSATCLLLSLRSQLKVAPLRLATGQCEPVTTDHLDGMVYICTGEGCDSSLLCHSMSLMRLESNWQGPIYVISDQQDFISESACDRNRPKYSVVVAPETPTMMHMKNLKRQLFDLIPANPTRLIYIDADILPVGCLHDFLSHETPEDIGMFLDSWCAGCNHFLSGFVYMKKTPKALECFEDWTTESSSDDFKRHKKDQDALDNVLRSQSVCKSAIHTMSSAYIETFDDNMIMPLVGVIRGRAPTFQHFTHGIRGLPVWPKIKKSIENQVVSGRVEDGTREE